MTDPKNFSQKVRALEGNKISLEKTNLSEEKPTKIKVNTYISFNENLLPTAFLQSF